MWSSLCASDQHFLRLSADNSAAQLSVSFPPNKRTTNHSNWRERERGSSVPSSVSLPQTEYTLISSLNLPEKFQHAKKKNTDYRRPYANRIQAAQTKKQMTKESTLRNNFAHCMTELLRNFATLCHERHMTYLKTGLYR